MPSYPADPSGTVQQFDCNSTTRLHAQQSLCIQLGEKMNERIKLLKQHFGVEE